MGALLGTSGADYASEGYLWDRADLWDISEKRTYGQVLVRDPKPPGKVVP